MDSERKTKDESKPERSCCVIRISNTDSKDAKDAPYWWNAIHELGNKLIDLGYGQFVITATPNEKSSSIMISYDGWPTEADGSKTFSEEVLIKLVWDLTKEFDYLISCKLDII